MSPRRRVNDGPPPNRYPVHFWPASWPPGWNPLPCGILRGAHLTTAVPALVTCKSCRRRRHVQTLLRGEQSERPRHLSPEEAIAAGWATVPPEEGPRTPPYVNPRRPLPRNRDLPSPLEAIADRAARRAEESTGETRAALESIAAELAALVDELRGSRW